MDRRQRVLASGAVGLVMLLGVPAPAPAVVLNCGDTVGPGGTVVLTADVGPCAVSPALTVVGPVILEMNGFTLECAPVFPGFDGILLDNAGAKVRNGTVERCDRSVVLAGIGKHEVRNVNAVDTSTGFHVISDRNRLLDNVARNVGGAGYQADGDFNVLTGNIAVDAHGVGFFVAGTNNRLTANTATLCESQGFDVPGPANRLLDNVAEANGTDGFVIGGDRTLARKNAAVGNLALGFSVSGDRTTLTGNAAERNESFGFVIHGSEHVVKQNAARDNEHAGFMVSTIGSMYIGNEAAVNGEEGIFLLSGALGNVLKNNEALGNGLNGQVDLRDDNAQCDNNKWTVNTFATSNQPCIQ